MTESVTITIELAKASDGGIDVSADLSGSPETHQVPEEDFSQIQNHAEALMANFESGSRPLADPVSLAELGRQLHAAFLEPFGEVLQNCFENSGGCLLLKSSEPDLLNLPWELLPGPGGTFLVANGGGNPWSIRRTVRQTFPDASQSGVPRPLRILFAASAPRGTAGLDFEREEEAFLRLTSRLGDKVHLEFGEAGTFDELRDLISEHQPHVVLLSGHGHLDKGIGRFAFENERGGLDSRPAAEMAGSLFAGRDVRLVFVSACRSGQSEASGICQALTENGVVPVALGWGASIADDWATEFAGQFYHELAAGHSIDAAVSAARRDLFHNGRKTIDDREWLDASFALPQVYAAEPFEQLIDESLPQDRPKRRSVSYQLLGDNIRGLREGFVGRRRLLQRTRPPLRDGDIHVLLLTGIGGAGKSTLATRIANRFQQEGYRIVGLRARRDEPMPFALRMLGEIATACQRLGREADEKVLNDGERPLAQRLRLAVDILSESRIVLVLDNLESLMPEPPEAPAWKDPDFAAFFDQLIAYLTGEGRAILTCRYPPEGFDPKLPNVAHEALPDFAEADFFKYLRRHEKVAARIAADELDRDLLADFHRKLGATPRFLEQAATILATIDPSELRDEIDGISDGAIREKQQEYFQDLFLPQLYAALPSAHQAALSRFAVVEIPVPYDGAAAVAGLPDTEIEAAVNDWLRFTLVQRFGEQDETPVFAIYPLQREFLTHPDRLDPDKAAEAHRAAAVFFRACYESGREDELRLPVMEELAACLYHATAGGDADSKRWATIQIARILISQSENRQAAALLEAHQSGDWHPDVLKTLADAKQRLAEWQEARRLYEKAAAEYEAISDRAGEATTWHELASIDLKEGNYPQARDLFIKNLEMLQAIGDRVGEADTWHQLATIELREGNYPQARDLFKKALEMRQAIGDRVGEAGTWHNLATIELREGNYPQARDLFKKNLEMLLAIGDRAGEASTWHQLASIEANEGNYPQARDLFKKALEMRQAIGDRAGEANTWHQLASIELNEGNYPQARDLFKKNLEMLQAIGDRAGEASTWHQLASIELKKGNYPQARDLFKKALEMRQGIGDRASEAATFNQIGLVAWENKSRDSGIGLVAISFQILLAIGSGDLQAVAGNLSGMAEKLDLDTEEAMQTLLAEAAEEYAKDRGAALVAKAFEAL